MRLSGLRELRTVLESAVMLTDSVEIDAEDLRLQGSMQLDQPVSLRLEDLEIWAVREALKRTKGSVSGSARLLGLSREGLAKMMRRYDIGRQDEDNEED